MCSVAVFQFLIERQNFLPTLINRRARNLKKKYSKAHNNIKILVQSSLNNTNFKGNTNKLDLRIF